MPVLVIPVLNKAASLIGEEEVLSGREITFLLKPNITEALIYFGEPSEKRRGGRVESFLVLLLYDAIYQHHTN
jgi:hypothetical protein